VVGCDVNGQDLISLSVYWEKKIQTVVPQRNPVLQNKKIQEAIIASKRQDQMAQSDYNAKG